MTESAPTPLEEEPEGEPGALIRAELGRLVHDPRQEVARLKSEEREGESGATPFIAIGVLAPSLIALVIAFALTALAVYYLVG